VLQDRRTVCVIADCVGKPTDEKSSRCSAKATDAHPCISGNGDRSLLAPARNPQSRAGANDYEDDLSAQLRLFHHSRLGLFRNPVVRASHSDTFLGRKGVYRDFGSRR
jgi:hypothetical protein